MTIYWTSEKNYGLSTTLVWAFNLVQWRSMSISRGNPRNFHGILIAHSQIVKRVFHVLLIFSSNYKEGIFFEAATSMYNPWQLCQSFFMITTIYYAVFTILSQLSFWYIGTLVPKTSYYTRLLPSRFSCPRCGLWVGFDEFAMHQGKDGGTDWFLADPNKTC